MIQLFIDTSNEKVRHRHNQGCGVDEFWVTPTPTPTPAQKYRIRLQPRLHFDSGLIGESVKKYDTAVFLISLLIVSKYVIRQYRTRSR